MQCPLSFVNFLNKYHQNCQSIFRANSLIGKTFECVTPSGFLKMDCTFFLQKYYPLGVLIIKIGQIGQTNSVGVLCL